jgi:hypothetical protein
MKKTLNIFLALVMVLTLALSLAACGSTDDTSNDNAGTSPQAGSDATAATGSASQEPADGGQAMTSLIQWMIDGTFSYDFTMTAEGPEGKTESTGSMAMDGKNMAVTTEMTVEGQQVKSRIIVKDDVTYIVDDANKLIMKAPGGMNATAGMITDYSGIAPVGSGTGEIGGKTLPYEEYSQEGAMVRYYMDGGQVYGIESEYEGYRSVMIITNPSKTIPSGAFDLPEGYAQM